MDKGIVQLPFNLLFGANVGMSYARGADGKRHVATALEIPLELGFGMFGVRLGGLIGQVKDRQDPAYLQFAAFGATVMGFFPLGRGIAYAGVGWFPLGGSTYMEDGSATKRESSAVRPLVGVRRKWFSLGPWTYTVALELAYMHGYGSGPEPVYSGGASGLVSTIVGW